MRFYLSQIAGITDFIIDLIFTEYIFVNIFGNIFSLETLLPGELFVNKREFPISLEIDCIDQHQSGVRAESTWVDQVLDLLHGLLRNPSVDLIGSHLI